jgi:hypothetical protein
MESRFGHDFSQVRVHTDARAAESARAVDAAAYTVGRHLVFGADRYSPTMESGRRLLAHELIHSVQQGFASDPRPQRVDAPGTALERQADDVAEEVLGGVSRSVGHALAIPPAVQSTSLQREEAESPKIDLPAPQEEIRVPYAVTARETVPPDCRNHSLVLSWEGETCCSNRGFPDPGATRGKGEKECCNTFPPFVDRASTQRGFDGAASCKPRYLGFSATVTPEDTSRPAVRVICTDTRANNNEVIELGPRAALKAYGNTHLKERGKVCYETGQPGTCYVKTDCNETVHPKESQCLAPGCRKTAAPK